MSSPSLRRFSITMIWCRFSGMAAMTVPVPGFGNGL